MISRLNIKRVRQNLGLSQEGFANALLIRPVLVRQWEAGRETASPHFINLIEQHFQKSIQDLINNSPAPTNDGNVAQLAAIDEKSIVKNPSQLPKPWAKKVLLIFPQPSNKNNYINTLPPLGILTIAGYLRRQGIDVDVIDGQIMQDHSWLQQLDSYDVIGFSINTANVETAMKHLDIIKSNGCRALIAFGGPHALAAPEVFIQHPHIDAVFVGEGERSFYEFLTSTDPKSVLGLYIKDSQNPLGY
ncbi:cobalamin-dependent protein, partial [PVC group bacterium]|nr:cobalamin-dependent protein [PVC group bacterium]